MTIKHLIDLRHICLPMYIYASTFSRNYRKKYDQIKHESFLTTTRCVSVITKDKPFVLPNESSAKEVLTNKQK